MINLLIQIKFRKGYYFFTCFKEFLEKNPVVRQIPAVRYMKLVVVRRRRVVNFNNQYIIV